jgi:tetratricopeptide (TPR) repeat protein
VSRVADARLAMLQTVRAFALGRLEDEDEAAATAEAHATYHAGHAAREAARLHGHDQLAALDRLRAGDADLAAALVWLLSNDAVAALDLAVTLAPYWDTISALSEGRSWLIRARSAVGDDASWVAVAMASTWSSYFAALRGEFDAADRMASTALQIWEAHGIDAGRGYALLMLGFAAVERGDLDSGERMLTASADALERSGDRWGHARPLNNLAELARMRGDLDRAEQLHARALAIVRDVGDLGSQPNMLCGLGHVYLARGEVTATESLAREAIGISERLGNRLGTASALELLALAHRGGDPKGAARLLGAASALRERLGAPVESRDRPLLDAARRHLEHTEEWHAGAVTPLTEFLASALR